jgi:hypothetical protein
MRVSILAVGILPLLSSALNLEVTPADEEKVVHRLKAGRDLNLQEKIGEGEGAEKDGEEWGLWGFGNNHPKKHHKTLRVAAKDATNESKIFALNAKPKGTRKKDGESKVMDLIHEQNMHAEQQISEVQKDISIEKDDNGEYRPRMEVIASPWQMGQDSNVEVFWQRPKGTVKGVMFGATGCFHQGGDFFQQHHKDGWEFKECKQSKLRRCQGLPDNVYAFKYALERDYLVLTVTPQGKNSCWEHQDDPKRVNIALQHVLKKEGLPEDTPMFATGASQGGYFMFDMQNAGLKNLKCIAPQCAELKEQTHKEHLPTMMIYMPKDYEIYGAIQGSIAYLRNRLNGKLAVRTPHPWAVHELMQARGFDNATVEAVRKSLKKAKGPFGHDPMTDNGYIVDHPGTDGWWKKALRRVFTYKQDSLKKDHSVMHHIMQVAYAEHEFTAEYMDQIIDFCESNGKVDPQTPLRFGRKIEGGKQQFNVKASGVNGKEEEEVA